MAEARPAPRLRLGFNLDSRVPRYQRTIRVGEAAAASALGRTPAACPAVCASPWIEPIDVHTPCRQAPCIVGLSARQETQQRHQSPAPLAPTAACPCRAMGS